MKHRHTIDDGRAIAVITLLNQTDAIGLRMKLDKFLWKQMRTHIPTKFNDEYIYIYLNRR